MASQKIILNYSGNMEQDLFNPNARDNYHEPYIVLKNELKKLGFTIEQQSDQVFKDCKYILYWDVTTLPTPATFKEIVKRVIKKIIKNSNGTHARNWIKEAISHGKADSLVLILWEGKAVCPENYKKESYKQFSKILTWDDSLVDGKKFFKFSLPIPDNVPKVNEVNFSEKKLLVNISSNKISKYPYELYSERIKTIRYFEQSCINNFDLYGYGWDNLAKNIKPFLSYQGTVKNKWDILPKYKFAVCYENNNNQKGYITEKIFDCLRADCVPIYWGAPNIADYVKPDCFIDRRKFSSNKELEKYIINISNKDYHNFREAIKSYLNSELFRQFLPGAFFQTFIQNLGLKKIEDY